VNFSNRRIPVFKISSSVALKRGAIDFSRLERLGESPIPCGIKPDNRQLDSMNRHEKGLEFKVGIFVFIGCAALAALVVKFGRLGEGVKTYYQLTVRFADASGLLKSSDVLLGGAKIGRVSGGPHLVRDGPGVYVPLRIYDYVKIPVGSKFTVGSSGLLGDRFVTVTPPAGQATGYIQKDTFIDGTRESGFDDLTKHGNELIGDVRTTVQKLNQETLSAQNMENLKASMEHLNEATSALAASSKKLDGVIEQADSTMASAKKAADGLQSAIADTRKVLRSAMQGKGLVATLLNDQQLANDLHALINNLRAHGVLFYRDSTAGRQEKPGEQTQPTHQSRAR
jgi:phospholipid/cholesterol/gamma-HCH transport system substrate-binding protein